MNKLKDLTGFIREGKETADELTESNEERQRTLNERHETDMKSDSFLSKNIRPGVVLILLLIEVFMIVLESEGKPVSTDTKMYISGLLGAAIGFYFDSKRRERIAEKNAEANLKLTKLEAREKRREASHNRRMQRKNS